ncbi:MAG: NAD(P)H-hydrate epimerase [Nitriliruptoraceae bacterium]
MNEQPTSADDFWTRLRSALDAVDADERRPPPAARAGAVLVLLEMATEGPQVVLTRRRQDMRSHPGQVSFPGGRIDGGETVEQAAVREAEEEIGLDASSIEVLGTAPRLYIPPSRFWIVPVVARWVRPHRLTENPWEVDEIIRVPFAVLADSARQRRVRLAGGPPAWAWQLNDDLVWGATARVLHGVLDIAVDDWHAGRRPDDLDDAAAVEPWTVLPPWRRRRRLGEDLPVRTHDEVPHVTADTMRAARAWMHVRGVGLRERAEQAGRAVADAVQRLHGASLAGVDVSVLAGPSSNGAGGLAAARLLATAGANVRVFTVGTPRAPEQTHVLRDVGVAIQSVSDVAAFDDHDPGRIVVDAMLGIGIEPPLRDLPHHAALWLQRHDTAIVALELPSGLAADEGIAGPFVSADVTIALGLPLACLPDIRVQAIIGDVYLADLGFPAEAWRQVGVDVPAGLFADGPLVRLEATHADDGADDENQSSTT